MLSSALSKKIGGRRCPTVSRCDADCASTTVSLRLSLYHEAEFSFETNAAPVGGYVSSDLLEVNAGEGEVVLQTMGWTDDFEDLPMTYEFGYSHGWHEVLSVFR